MLQNDITFEYMQPLNRIYRGPLFSKVKNYKSHLGGPNLMEKGSLRLSFFLLLE